MSREILQVSGDAAQAIAFGGFLMATFSGGCALIFQVSAEYNPEGEAMIPDGEYRYRGSALEEARRFAGLPCECEHV